jgi:hypothetical protein
MKMVPGPRITAAAGGQVFQRIGRLCLIRQQTSKTHLCAFQGDHMPSDIKSEYIQHVVGQQDANGCWNVLSAGDQHYPDLNYYVPNFRSTLWTLVTLADIKTPVRNKAFHRPLQIMSDHLLDKSAGIFTIGKSHFPIPCLNGNMLYLHGYFRLQNRSVTDHIIDFFNQYQRFDDGDFKTPSSFPYCTNRSCYGKHTCYWGVIKLLKGLSFIPQARRSRSARELARKCIDFILLHEVCYSSHNKTTFLAKSIPLLTFPNMYRADFLEILWLLKREGVRSSNMTRALHVLLSKQHGDATWHLERPNKELLVPLHRSPLGNTLVTERAREVSDYYQGRLTTKRR